MAPAQPEKPHPVANFKAGEYNCSSIAQPRKHAALPIRRHILYDQHKTDDAINEYRKAINLDPRYADPQINLGNALSDQHKTDDAINEYHKAIDLDPRFALAHCNLGNALRKRHNNGEPDEANIEFDKAIVEYREAIELDPHDATAHRNLSYALRREGGTAMP